jgi:hypothetical protein
VSFYYTNFFKLNYKFPTSSFANFKFKIGYLYLYIAYYVLCFKLSISVKTFRSQTPVDILIYFQLSAFLYTAWWWRIWSQKCVCSWGLYSYSVICVGLIYCACSWGSYSYSVICVGMIYCACSWGLYSYSVIWVGLIYCACSWGLYSYSVICVGLIYCTVCCFIN